MPSKNLRNDSQLELNTAALLLGTLALLWIGSEWIFLVTQTPSIPKIYTSWQLARFLLFPAIVFMLGVYGLLLLPLSRTPKILRVAGLLIASFLLAGTLLLLVDNFTYSVWRMGIVTSDDQVRRTYLLLFLLAWISSYRLLSDVRKKLSNAPVFKTLRLNRIAASALLLLGVQFAFEFSSFDFQFADLAVSRRDANLPISRPHIVLFGIDGVEARQLSLYGNPQPTTPFLASRRADAVIARNAYANAGNTSASLLSLLTGKSPLTTKTLFPPQSLQKPHVHQHLPFILNKLGYRSLQETMRFYSDSLDFNLQSSFHEANDRKTFVTAPFPMLNKIAYAFNEEIFFSTKIVSRLSDRLLHIAGVRPMPHLIRQVLENFEQGGDQDARRVDSALRFLREAPSPAFVHLHLMSSHGVFSSHARSPHEKHPLSNLQIQDALFEKLVKGLEERSLLSNTIIVLYSDHTHRWDTHERIPLAFWIPNRKGEVTPNASLIDVAPTILDAMNVSTPDWMDGQSLLAESLDVDRPIDTVLMETPVRGPMSMPGGFFIKELTPALNRYGIATIRRFSCDRWVEASLLSGSFHFGRSEDHEGSCTLPSSETAERERHALTALLAKRGLISHDFQFASPLLYERILDKMSLREVSRPTIAVKRVESDDKLFVHVGTKPNTQHSRRFSFRFTSPQGKVIETRQEYLPGMKELTVPHPEPLTRGLWNLQLGDEHQETRSLSYLVTEPRAVN